MRHWETNCTCRVRQGHTRMHEKWACCINCWWKTPFYSYVNRSRVSTNRAQRETIMTIFQINKLYLDFLSFSHSTLSATGRSYWIPLPCYEIPVEFSSLSSEFQNEWYLVPAAGSACSVYVQEQNHGLRWFHLGELLKCCIKCSMVLWMMML